MDLRAVAVDEIHWITGNAPEAELWAEDRWLAVAQRGDAWMLVTARRSGPDGAAVATSDFSRDTTLTDTAVVAGAGVISPPATSARVDGLGSRDVVAATSRIWLVGLLRDNSDAAEVVRVELLDQAGNRTGRAIPLHRNR